MSRQIHNFVRLKWNIFVTDIFRIVCFNDPNWVINCFLTKKTSLLEAHSIIKEHVWSRKNSCNWFKNFSCEGISCSRPWSKGNFITNHTCFFVEKFAFSRNQIIVLLHFWKIFTQKNWFQMFKIYNRSLTCGVKL